VGDKLDGGNLTEFGKVVFWSASGSLPLYFRQLPLAFDRDFSKSGRKFGNLYIELRVLILEYFSEITDAPAGI
jgi:hypothetical protein